MVFDNRLDNQGDTHPDAWGEPWACELTTGLPFRLACGMACVRDDTRHDIRADTHIEPRHSPQSAFCDYGLSAPQINVLALVQRAGARITPYERISRQLAQEFGMPHSAESVRGIVSRLAARGFFRRKQAKDGTIRGVRFIVAEAMLCPHIPAVQADARSGVRGDARPELCAAPSILKETDRKNLSISSGEAKKLESIRRLEAMAEDDIAFHWPELAHLGFGTHQVRQILQRLAQVGVGPEQIMQGLTHAEWELTAGKMHDKSGSPVSSPLDWVFKSLATTGYYRRPKEYISPQEQAERDAIAEKNKLAAARAARFEAEYAVWATGLSEEERKAILDSDGRRYIPPHIPLKEYFRATVWQTIHGEDAKNPPTFNEGGGQDV